MTSDLNMSHKRMSDFASFLMLLFNLFVKLTNFNFESILNTLIFFIKKYMSSNLNISHGKVLDFVSFSLFGFTLVIKLKNFDFESHRNTLIFFD